jgi:hypothetical protein
MPCRFPHGLLAFLLAVAGALGILFSVLPSSPLWRFPQSIRHFSFFQFREDIIVFFSPALLTDSLFSWVLLLEKLFGDIIIDD